MKTSGHLKSASQSAILGLTVLAAGRAHATDGYFDHVQLFIAPTLSYKLTENNAIGLAPIIAYQRFKAYGLENFAFRIKAMIIPMAPASASVTRAN